MEPKTPYTFIEKIQIIARRSALSKVQVEEVLVELRHFYPYISCELLFMDTKGDLDKKSSLRTMENSDFFTHEIDQFQKVHRGRIAVHSAKDLPSPLPEHLILAALTKGVDPADCLIFRGEHTLHSLPKRAKVATSSLRREEKIKALRDDLIFVDIRGTIEERLLQLELGMIDALVMAEAALIRLQLTHLPRMKLSGETVPGQGKLALVIHKEDVHLKKFLIPLDSR